MNTYGVKIGRAQGVAYTAEVVGARRIPDLTRTCDVDGVFPENRRSVPRSAARQTPVHTAVFVCAGRKAPKKEGLSLLERIPQLARRHLKVFADETVERFLRTKAEGTRNLVKRRTPALHAEDFHRAAPNKFVDPVPRRVSGQSNYHREEVRLGNAHTVGVAVRSRVADLFQQNGKTVDKIIACDAISGLVDAFHEIFTSFSRNPDVVKRNLFVRSLLLHRFLFKMRCKNKQFSVNRQTMNAKNSLDSTLFYQKSTEIVRKTCHSRKKYPFFDRNDMRGQKKYTSFVADDRQQPKKNAMFDDVQARGQKKYPFFDRDTKRGQRKCPFFDCDTQRGQKKNPFFDCDTQRGQKKDTYDGFAEKREINRRK